MSFSYNRTRAESINNANSYNIYDFPDFSFDTTFEREYLARIQKENEQMELEKRMREKQRDEILANDLLKSTTKEDHRQTTVDLNEPLYQYSTSSKSNSNLTNLPPIPTTSKSSSSSLSSSQTSTPVPPPRSSSQPDTRTRSNSNSFSNIPTERPFSAHSSSFSQIPHTYSTPNIHSQHQQFSDSQSNTHRSSLPAFPTFSKATSPMSQYSNSFTTDKELFCYQKCLELGYSSALSSFAVSAYLGEEVKVFDFITKVQQLETLGFATEQAKEALLVTDREINAALDYLSNPK